jgi:hypothetical protein
MMHRAERTALIAAVTLSLFAGVSPAQKRPISIEARLEPGLTSPSERPKTPYERYMKPKLDELAQQAKAKAKALPLASSATSGATAPSPNFAGFLSGTAYETRAANSAQYDPANNGVGAVLAADFNKDGLTDLAVLQNDGTVNVLINSASGGLSAPIGYLNTGANVDSISISQAFTVDLNGDGYPDIVAYDQNNLQILSWLNGGDGSFTQPILTPLDQTQGSAAGIALGDVNGDGKVDVVAAYYNYLSSTTGTVGLQTFKGNGDATFTSLPVQSYTIPYYAQLPGTNPIAIGDVTGDGRADIAFFDIQPQGRFSSSFTVFTVTGNGDGTFGLQISAPIISGNTTVRHTSGVQILDLNNDGKLDIVADANNTLYAALGQTGGTLATAVASAFDSSDGTIFADMNGDGILDAITDGSDALGVFLGKGNGTFTAPAANTQYAAFLNTGPAVAAADLNGDGKLDIAELSSSFFRVEIYTGNGDGSLHGTPALTLPDDPLPIDNQLLGVINANGDSFSDIFLANYLNNNLALYTGLGDGKGGFKYVPAIATSSLPADYYGLENFQADLNGDGKQDLILTGFAGEVWTSLSAGDGTFATPVAANMPTLSCPLSYGSAGDVNHDGKTDLVIAYPGDAPCGGSTYTSGYFVMLGKGDGSLQAPIFYPAGTELYSATLADVNVDGNLDLFLNDLPNQGTYQVTLQLGSGDGTFGASTPVLSNYLVTDFKIADINQDGKPDLVATEQQLAGTDFSTSGILLIQGNGDGTFGARSQIATGNFFNNLQLADVNGDGIPDVEAAQTSYFDQANSYFGFVTMLGLGQGAFGAPHNTLVENGSIGVFTGNFIDDNALDLVVGAPGAIALFLNQGGTTAAITASAASINVGDSETLTATFSPTMSGRPAPLGTVSFYDGSTLLGAAQLAGGNAAFSMTGLSAGSHNFTASYGGDANFNPNDASVAVTVTVTSVAPAFTLAGTPSTLNLAQGANGTALLTLAANATFSGAVALTCSGAPANSTCGFNVSTVALNPGTTTNATLIIGTTGTVASAEAMSNLRRHPPATAALAGLIGIVLFRLRRLRIVSLLGVLLVTFVVFGVSGCSDGGRKASTPTAPVAAAGTYTIMVTASASGTTVPAQTTPVTVNIQ